MYKLTKPDGTDFYSGTINYVENVGKIVRIADYEGPEVGLFGKGIHAAYDPNDAFIGEVVIPCRVFKVHGIQRITGNRRRARYQAVEVLEEITDLDNLFGWKYSEVIAPMNPFEIECPKITDEHITLLNRWKSVRKSIWWSVHHSTRYSRYPVQGTILDWIWETLESPIIKTKTGAWAWTWDKSNYAPPEFCLRPIWKPLWESILIPIQMSIQSTDRMSKALVYGSVSDFVQAYTGSFFPNIKEWRYVKHEPDEYPFQPAVDLWKQGLVPSFDGKIWRLHSKDGIVWGSRCAYLKGFKT